MISPTRDFESYKKNELSILFYHIVLLRHKLHYAHKTRGGLVVKQLVPGEEDADSNIVLGIVLNYLLCFTQP